eukprot:3695-Heterococcus_DN1.PRE.5
MPMLKPKTPASIMFTMNAGLSSVSKCSMRASLSNHHTSGANMMHALMLFKYVSLQWSLSTAGSTCASIEVAVVIFREAGCAICERAEVPDIIVCGGQ